MSPPRGNPNRAQDADAPPTAICSELIRSTPNYHPRSNDDPRPKTNRSSSRLSFTPEEKRGWQAYPSHEQGNRKINSAAWGHTGPCQTEVDQNEAEGILAQKARNVLLCVQITGRCYGVVVVVVAARSTCDPPFIACTEEGASCRLTDEDAASLFIPDVSNGVAASETLHRGAEICGRV